MKLINTTQNFCGRIELLATGVPLNVISVSRPESDARWFWDPRLSYTYIIYRLGGHLLSVVTLLMSNT